jgi:hypothetical protein
MHLALCFKRHSSFKRDLLTDSLYTMIYAAATFRRDPPGKYSYSSGSKDPSRPPVRCRSTPFLKKRLSDSGSSPRSVFNAQSCRNVSSFPQLFRRLSRACLGKCSAFRIKWHCRKRRCPYRWDGRGRLGVALHRKRQISSTFPRPMFVPSLS